MGITTHFFLEIFYIGVHEPNHQSSRNLFFSFRRHNIFLFTALFLFSNMSVGIYIDSLEVFWQTIPDPFFTHAAINRACDKLHVYPECCEKFFLMYESYVSSGYLEKPIPRSLVHLCCCSIRECMGSVFQLPHGIDRLILPENLESYLRLNIPQEPKLKQLRSKFISGKTKLRLYKTLILPVLLYASETWTLNLETIRALETFERKALRTIFGPVKDQGCWHTRYNFELYRLYKEPQVTQVIRSNRLRWLGDIWRSPENNQTRAYTFKNPMGSRTRGRPPTRWIDEVENDLKTKYKKLAESCCVSLELEEASCGGSQDL
ncbi:SOCS box domain-containing protein [Trichonephila clavipes]|nr:SOCS box domain-containing protein [Trichonephila clavipes]